MKGLFIKDLKILKSQKSFFFVIVLIGGGFILTGQSGAVSYLTVMLSILVITTIGYDEQNNGYGFLFTLPISRNLYVLEKYILGILLPIFGAAAGILLTVVYSIIKSVHYERGMLIAIVLAGLLMSAVMQAITIPIQFRFGMERSRIAMFVAMGIVVTFGYLFMEIGKKCCVDAGVLFEQAIAAGPWMILCGGIVIMILLMGISLLISLKIMKGKQF